MIQYQETRDAFGLSNKEIADKLKETMRKIHPGLRTCYFVRFLTRLEKYLAKCSMCALTVRK